MAGRREAAPSQRAPKGEWLAHPPLPQRSLRQKWLPRKIILGRQRGPLIIALALLLLCSLAGTIDTFLSLSRAYTEASDAALHLHRLETLVSSSSSLPKLLAPATLQQLHQDLTAAQHDFALLQSETANPLDLFSLAAQHPLTNTTITSAKALIDAANEACFAGLDVVKSLKLLTGIAKTGFFASSNPPSQPAAPPLLDTPMLTQLQRNAEDAFQHLNAAALYARSADVSALLTALLKPKQAAEIQQILTNWPEIQTEWATVDAWLSMTPTLLGTNTPENLLIELMDRSELRSTGGFIGNYGVMTIDHGQIQPFTLSDTYLLDNPYTNDHESPPPALYPWWPFYVFGLRDSNISANFPTAAQTGMQMLSLEGGPAVQGVIAVTPPAIERIIDIVGPITVSDYHQVVTAQNLEQLIHYYQHANDQDLLANVPPGDQISSPRKRFTALLAHAFLEKLHGLSGNKLAAIGKALITSLHTKDIQIYLQDKNAEALLAKEKLNGAITQGPGDGVTIIDSNVGGNKGNQFTVASYTDHITLDTQGTATHHLTITYNYKVTDPTNLFGKDRYLTYLRIYAPPNAHLISLKGLNVGHNEINESDEPGRQMWGEYVQVQDGKPYSLHLVWSVPHAATADGFAHWHYQLVFQHQAGSNQQLALTVTLPEWKMPTLTYQGALNSDKTYDISYL